MDKEEDTEVWGTCGVCGCESNKWGEKWFWGHYMGKVLSCPAQRANPRLHEKIDWKIEATYSDQLPESVKNELKLEIEALKKQILQELQLAQTPKA